VLSFGEFCFLAALGSISTPNDQVERLGQTGERSHAGSRSARTRC
jgi:hypothetical protein